MMKALKTLEKSKFLQKLTELYFPEDPQPRRRMNTTATVLGVIGIVLFVLSIIDLLR